MKNTELLYGIHTINNVLHQSPERILKLTVVAGRHDKRLQKLIADAKHHHIHMDTLEKKQLDKMLGDVNHQGVIAECRAKRVLDEDDLMELLEGLDHPPLLLVLDGVQDPHNLGACLRTADAAGVDAVICPRDRSVSLTSTAQKVASGATESIAFVQVTNLARTLRQLKEAGIWCFGLADKATETIYQANLTGPLALIMGAEGTGMRHLTEEHCDAVYSIPMAGAVSSLNVSVATGVCLFEAVRQR